MNKTYEIVKDDQYFRDVLGNMRSIGFDGCRVQFGETGKGFAPNYMIVDGRNRKHMFHGMGHKPYTDKSVEQFSEDKLSDPLTVDEVMQEISKRNKKN